MKKYEHIKNNTFNVFDISIALNEITIFKKKEHNTISKKE